jgi:hypothetical protein
MSMSSTASMSFPAWPPARGHGIKASDFTDNAVGIIHTTGPKLARLAAKYGPLVPALRELILRAATPLDAGVKDMIAAQLDAARERFTAIGHGRDSDTGRVRHPARLALSEVDACSRRMPAQDKHAGRRSRPATVAATQASRHGVRFR